MPSASSSGYVELVEWLIDVYKVDPNHGKLASEHDLDVNYIK